jgi:hypothetical protein
MGLRPAKKRFAKASLITQTFGARRAILLQDVSSPQDGDAERGEVGRAHGIGVRLAVRVAFRRIAFHVDRVRRIAAAEDTEVGEARRAHAGNLREPAEQLERHALALHAVRDRVLQIDAYEQQALRGKAEVRALQVVDRPREQARSDEQGQREGQLQADEEPARAHLLRRSQAAAARKLEALTGVGPGALPGRQHAEDERGSQGHGHDEAHDRRAEGEAHVEARIGLHHQPHQRAVQEERDRDGGHSAQGREGQALRDELPDETPAARPQRQPQRDFRLARGGAGEQEIGQVRARDQQEHPDRGQQRGEGVGEFRRVGEAPRAPDWTRRR